MTKKEFNAKLKELNLSIVEFSKISNVSYPTANGWNDDTKRIPAWVSSWLENYEVAKNYKDIQEKAKKYDDIKKIIESN